MAASFSIFVRVIISACNIQVTLAVAAQGGRQQLVRRSDRMPGQGVVAATMAEWVAAWHASSFGAPAWLAALEGGDFKLSVDGPRGLDTAAVAAAVKAGIAAGKPKAEPVTEAAPVAEEAKPKARKSRKQPTSPADYL